MRGNRRPSRPEGNERRFNRSHSESRLMGFPPPPRKAQTHERGADDFQRAYGLGRLHFIDEPNVVARRTGRAKESFKKPGDVFHGRSSMDQSRPPAT
jgi:hypothetical protein